MVRNRSWPAVSQICSLTRFPSSSMVLILKSMPMVVMKDGVKESSLKRSRQHDLPTPESPIRSSLIYSRVGVSGSRLRRRATQGGGNCPEGLAMRISQSIWHPFGGLRWQDVGRNRQGHGMAGSAAVGGGEVRSYQEIIVAITRHGDG